MKGELIQMEKELKLVICAVLSIRWRSTEKFLHSFISELFLQSKKVKGVKTHIVLSYEIPEKETWKVFEQLRQDFPALTLLPSPAEKTSTANLYLRGFQYALDEKADLIFEIDASRAHDEQQIPLFIDKAASYLRKSPDAMVSVFSTRFSVGGKNYFPKGRVFLSRFTTFCSHLFLLLGKTGWELTDLTSGFEVFSGSLLRRMFETVKPGKWVSLWWGPLHLFQSEARAIVCWIAKKEPVKIYELPITFGEIFKGATLPPLKFKYVATAVTGGFLLFCEALLVNLKLILKK